jgi:hypothetical protein
MSPPLCDEISRWASTILCSMKQDNSPDNYTWPHGDIALSPSSSNHPSRLYDSGDEKILNDLHIFLRKELIEIVVGSDGFVRLRCPFCKGQEEEHTVKLQSIEKIYSICTRWARVHFFVCCWVPEELKTLYKQKKMNDKKRGNVDYWAECAQRMGLKNVEGGVKFV